MIFIALILSPVLAYKHALLQWIGANVNWDSRTEPYMSPEMTQIDPKFGPDVFLSHNSKTAKVKRSAAVKPPKVESLKRDEKRKINDLLNFLNKYTCIETLNSNLIKNCAFPIEIKF